MHAAVCTGHGQALHLQVGAGQHADGQRDGRLIHHRRHVEAEVDRARIVRIALDGQRVGAGVGQCLRALVGQPRNRKQVVAVRVHQAPVGVAAAARQHVEEVAVAGRGIKAVQLGLVGRRQLAADCSAGGNRRGRGQIEQAKAEDAGGGIAAIDNQRVLARTQIEAGVVEPGVVVQVAVAKHRHAVFVQHAPDDVAARGQAVKPQLAGMAQREAVALGVAGLGDGAGGGGTQGQRLGGLNVLEQREAEAGIAARLLLAFDRQQVVAAARQQHAVKVVVEIIAADQRAAGCFHHPPVSRVHIAVGSGLGKQPVSGNAVKSVDGGAAGRCQRAGDGAAIADCGGSAHIDQTVGKARHPGIGGVDRERVVAGSQQQGAEVAGGIGVITPARFDAALGIGQRPDGVVVRVAVERVHQHAGGGIEVKAEHLGHIDVGQGAGKVGQAIDKGHRCADDRHHVGVTHPLHLEDLLLRAARVDLAFQRDGVAAGGAQAQRAGVVVEILAVDL